MSEGPCSRNHRAWAVSSHKQSVMGLSGSALELKGLLNCLIHTGLRATVEDINPALP